MAFSFEIWFVIGYCFMVLTVGFFEIASSTVSVTFECAIFWRWICSIVVSFRVVPFVVVEKIIVDDPEILPPEFYLLAYV